MFRSFCVAMIALVGFGGARLSAQDYEKKPQTPDKGTMLLQSGQFAEAEKLFKEAVTADAGNATAWFQLGFARHLQKNYDGAIEAWTKAEGLGFQTPTANFNLACAHALSGKKDEAMRFLEKAVDAGFHNLNSLQSDPDIASLREDPHFQEIMKKVPGASKKE